MDSSSQYPTLSKAPIILATLEVKFRGAMTLGKEQIKLIRDSFKAGYPKQQDVNRTEFQVQPQAQQTRVSIKTIGLDGLQFISDSNKHELFISNDTYRFHQHGEYENWSAFKKVAFEGLLKLVEILKPTFTTRFSIRYINSLEIPIVPETIHDQRQFFRTAIMFEQMTTPKPVSDYFFRYTHPDVGDHITVHFAQELKIGDGSKFPFIIDIDVLYVNDDPLDLEFLDQKLDILRNTKNDYFFDNITQTTLDLIK